MELNRKVIKGWIVFDWANSAYSLVIVSTIFPQIFSHELRNTSKFLGFNIISSEALYTFTISFSYLFILIIAPLLGGISDYGRNKKKYLQFFTLLGSLACVLMYFFNHENILVGLIGVFLGSIGFSGSMVFYNAYLPEIAPAKYQDRISAKGYAMGYIGSSILLILIVLSATVFNSLISELELYRVGFLMVAVWWIGWSAWTFKTLPNNQIKEQLPFVSHFKNGWRILNEVRIKIKDTPQLYSYLGAFFCLSLGIQTLWIISPLFAINTIGMDGSELITTVLIMQFLGVIGAMFYSKIAQKKGNVLALSLTGLNFIIVCFLGVIVQEKLHFYGIALLMGLAMGGLQSVSRSTFSKLITKETHHASFFSFYDVLEKLSILIGTLSIAVIYTYKITFMNIPNDRFVLAVLGLFFLIGVILLHTSFKKHLFNK